jgi:hypothetical protein
VVGGPAWISQDQFDIEAKPDIMSNPTDEQSRQMLRNLLEERFVCLEERLVCGSGWKPGLGRCMPSLFSRMVLRAQSINRHPRKRGHLPNRMARRLAVQCG